MNNYSTAVFLINDKVRAVRAIYEPDIEGKTPVKRETFKTLDQSLKVDDFVLVPTDTRWKMTVCKIVEIDVEAPIETHEKIEWIIGPVDTTEYRATIEMEDKAIRMMKDAERTHQREELRKKMFAHVDAEKLGALQIAKATDSDVLTIEAGPSS